MGLFGIGSKKKLEALWAICQKHFDTKSALLLFGLKRPAYGRSTICFVWIMLMFPGRKEHLEAKMGSMVKRRGSLAFDHFACLYDVNPFPQTAQTNAESRSPCNVEHERGSIPAKHAAETARGVQVPL